MDKWLHPKQFSMGCSCWYMPQRRFSWHCVDVNKIIIFRIVDICIILTIYENKSKCWRVSVLNHTCATIFILVYVDASISIPGPCITNVIATCRKNFSQWERSFLWKLRCHWLIFLRRVAQTLVIQGPGLYTYQRSHPSRASSIYIDH